MGPRYLLRKGPAPWFSAPGLAPLGPNRTLLSCFPSRSDTRSGSCLTETPPVCSALCHHHVLPPLSPEPHSVERLWGPRTTAGMGRAQSQLGTGWWGGAADFLLVRPRLYFLFQLGPFSQPEGPALPPECFQGFIEVVCAARYFLWC